MFKLLTDEARRKVSHEYALRRAMLAIAGLSVVLVVGIVALVPSYVISLAHINAAKERTIALQNSPTREKSKELVASLEGINLKLKTLAPGTPDMPYEYFLKVIDVKPKGVKLNNFSWLKDKKSVTISIQGTANSRQDLLDFENRLNSSGNFSKAILPVSNFAKDKDIDFDLSLLVTK